MQNSATTLAAAAADTAKKATSKSKEALCEDLGMSQAELTSRTIVWVPFPVTEDDSRLLKAVAQARTTDKKSPVKVFRAPSDALAKWLEDSRAALTEEAKDALKDDERTEDELSKELAAMERKMAKLAEMLKAKQAAEQK
jgi:hypothetical protein